MKKFLSFMGICLCVLGTLGSIGYLVWSGQYPFAVGVGVLAYAAYPKVVGWYENLYE